MITAPELVKIAEKHHAVCTEMSEIEWDHRLRLWVGTGHRPSLIDAAILENAVSVGPQYLEAMFAATGWSRDTWRGFQTIMLLGEPVETSTMTRKNMSYWHGVMMGLIARAGIRKEYERNTYVLDSRDTKRSDSVVQRRHGNR